MKNFLWELRKTHLSYKDAIGRVSLCIHLTLATVISDPCLHYVDSGFGVEQLVKLLRKILNEDPHHKKKKIGIIQIIIIIKKNELHWWRKK